MCKNSELHLRSYFQQNGILLCNENKELPYLDSVGGDWNGIIALIERGEVFYSKLYKGRVTYLSREFYYQIKPHKRRLEKLSEGSRQILEFITTAELVTTKELKGLFPLSAKVFNGYMDELFKELFVTAVARDKTMNVNWSSFCWGTAERWESLKPCGEMKPDRAKLEDLLAGVMTDKQIQALLK